MKRDSFESYTLGVDCFPTGTRASIAKDGVVVETFTTESNGAAIQPLMERTQYAVNAAEQLMGAAPNTVSIACIDDGGDGFELQAMRERFDCNVDDTPLNGDASGADLSELRASQAAVQLT